ncbi:fumarylacetoacetate hydrolase [Botryosphaeria dothidea]|uniref:Fumarylacetoacetate hydrolase n=1 Tax=Botryosphaeria dothidea TaxID=55169 RepID=A0A8H4IJZ8_9PEZI|nr:fumarylacetoacetate hydrolase [Botryosphaeria dothidea]
MIPTTWDRLVRFIAAEDGKEYIGEPTDPDLDVGAALASSHPVTVRIFATTTALSATAQPTTLTRTIRTLLPPLTPREVGTIRCIGLNYRLHAQEMNLPLPTHPTLFFKPATSLGAPNAPLLIPHQATSPPQADYEAELAVILGKACRNATRENALDHVLGYACANDVTARAHQFAGAQWGFGKGFDGFAPVGPCVVSAARRVRDARAVELRTVLNGAVVQEACAEDMIFGVAEIVAYLSQGTTLEAGTVILTGTPCGIGVSRTPPVFLRHGDDLRVVMSHGLGSLVNTVVYEEGPEEREVSSRI